MRKEGEKCVHRFSCEERPPWSPRHILKDNIKMLRKWRLVMWNVFFGLLKELSAGLL